MATPCASATASRISESGVERGGSTSPTTLPKSNLRLGLKFSGKLLHALVIGEAVHTAAT